MPVKIDVREGAPHPVIDDRYEIIREISDGDMAWTYEARHLRTQQRVFLKYYKSPTPLVDWYQSYTDYVYEINKRLESSSAATYCVLCTDLFTANPRPQSKFSTSDFLFQAFDFIDSGYDLRKRMDEGIDWRGRVIMAKLFLMAMKSIHSAGVVHCDLKPENVQMQEVKDPTVAAKWVPRLIDMDRSILVDKVAPWVTGDPTYKEGYVGTPNYFSPEHLTGATPCDKSDVFTMAIILGELLGGGHPFAAYTDDKNAYNEAALHGKFRRIELQGPLKGTPQAAHEFCDMLNRCLSPNPQDRPTSAELHAALLQADKAASSASGPTAPAAPAPSAAPATPATPAPSATPPQPAAAPQPTPPTPEAPGSQDPGYGLLVLSGDKGALHMACSANLGRVMLSDISSDAASFVARYVQFRVEHDSETKLWYVLPPVAEPPNPTALNGEILTQKTLLHEGDIICLKGKTSGRTAVELRVSFV